MGLWAANQPTIIENSFARLDSLKIYVEFSPAKDCFLILLFAVCGSRVR